MQEEARRDKAQKSKEPVINSITDKIKHNIQVSRKLLSNVTPPAQRADPESELLFLKKEEENYQHIVSL